MAPGDRLQSAAAWREAVADDAAAAENDLYQLVNDYGVCLICDLEYKASLASHLAGQKHYKQLGYKTGWTWPADTARYVQLWQCNDGSRYSLNHLTFQHGPAGAPAAAGTPQVEAPPPPPPPPPPPAAVPQQPSPSVAPGPGVATEAPPQPPSRRWGKPGQAVASASAAPTPTPLPPPLTAAAEAQRVPVQPARAQPAPGRPAAAEPAQPDASGAAADAAGAPEEPPTEQAAEEPKDGWSKVPNKKGKKKDRPAKEAGAPPTAAPGPAGTSSSSTSDGRRLECAACGKALPHANFSGSQLNKKNGERKCKACIQKADAESSAAPACVKCKQPREWDDYFKKSTNWDSPVCKSCVEEEEAEKALVVCSACKRKLQRGDYRNRVDWENPTCRACLEEEEAERAFAVCAACDAKLHRSSFRNRVDWDSPTCRACLEEREHREYQERLEEYQEEVLRRQQEREEMGEAQREAYIEERILAPARRLFGELPRSRAEAAFHGNEENPELLEWAGDRRFTWAAKLAMRIEEAMSSGKLTAQWCHETPSRDHASDTEAANAFKELEDVGDRLVQDESARLFERFVLGEEIVECSREELLDSVQPLEDGRSWSWSGRGMVVAAARPLGGWGKVDCVAEDLRAEPRSGVVHAGTDMFAQFDQDAHAKLRRILPPGSRVQAKLYREAFWSGLEQSLYEGRPEVGSHNQTFSRAYGLAGGTGAGANRTEIMNLVADMLGFYDLEKYADNPKQYAPDQLWASVYSGVLPPRLRVHYGSGKEFNADKAWKTKMEANLTEALIGALDKAGFKDLANAVVALCFLTYISAPSGMLPSNWAMAEKLVLLADKEELFDGFVVTHLDAKSFCCEVERMLT